MIYVICVEGGEYDTWYRTPISYATTKEAAEAAVVELSAKLVELHAWEKRRRAALEPVSWKHNQLFDSVAFEKVYNDWPKDNPRPMLGIDTDATRFEYDELNEYPGLNLPD